MGEVRSLSPYHGARPASGTSPLHSSIWRLGLARARASEHCSFSSGRDSSSQGWYCKAGRSNARPGKTHSSRCAATCGPSGLALLPRAWGIRSWGGGSVCGGGRPRSLEEGRLGGRADVIASLSLTITSFPFIPLLPASFEPPPPTPASFVSPQHVIARLEVVHRATG